MLSSLATFLFGSDKTCDALRGNTTTAGEVIAEPTKIRNRNRKNIRNDGTKIIALSVTSADDKKKPKNATQQNKRRKNKAPPSEQAKFLTTGGRSEEFDEDDWCIVEKEDEKEDCSGSNTDSELEFVSLPDVVEVSKPAIAVVDANQQQVAIQHISSHSLQSGPEPENFLSSPPICINKPKRSYFKELTPWRPNTNTECPIAKVDNGAFASLSLKPAIASRHHEGKVATLVIDAEGPMKMEESWYITPPPCFTSIGPIEVTSSPYENLLIEHPSMSVYCSIRPVMETAKKSIKVQPKVVAEKKKPQRKREKKNKRNKNSEAVQVRRPDENNLLDPFSPIRILQDTLTRKVQKVQARNESMGISRSAIRRANKTRDVHSKGQIRRRCDRQQSTTFSRANNNRKTNRC